VIPEIINEGNFDVLVMGTHGHMGFKDLLFELPLTNCDTRFIPLFIVKN
jgi:manganese transport protein